MADTEFLRTYAGILGPVFDPLLKVQALRTSEERFRLTVGEATDYAIFIINTEGQITDWFPGAAAVFGWSAEEAVGQSSATLFTRRIGRRGRTRGRSRRHVARGAHRTCAGKFARTVRACSSTA